MIAATILSTVARGLEVLFWFGLTSSGSHFLRDAVAVYAPLLCEHDRDDLGARHLPSNCPSTSVLVGVSWAGALGDEMIFLLGATQCSDSECQKCGDMYKELRFDAGS